MSTSFEVAPLTELEPWAREILDQQDAESARTEPVTAQPAAPLAAPHEGGLSADQAAMLDRMDILSPGDFQGVAMLLEMHPEIRNEILARAQQVCGNDTVAKALDVIQDRAKAPEEPEAQAQEQPTAEAAVDAAAAITQPATQTLPVEEFEYVVSPLALQYDHAEKVRDHVAYIRNHPELRDKILIAAAEIDAQLAEEVQAALEGVVPPEQAPAQPAPAGPAAAETPDVAAQAEEFEYVTSWLALQYDHDQKIIDHVDFLRNNPALRDAVLSGAAEVDPEFAEEVRVALDEGITAPAVAETEPTPPDVVQEAAEQAAPIPVDPVSAMVEVAPEPEPEPEPGWVTRAREFQNAHSNEAEQFNEITRGSCLGPDGQLDPNLVANWQVEHGVAPDGRVGDQTVTAAILDIPVTYAEAAEMAQASGLPPPDPTDPQFLQ